MNYPKGTHAPLVPANNLVLSKNLMPAKNEGSRKARVSVPRQTYSGLTKTDAKASRYLNPLESVEQKLFLKNVQGAAYLFPELLHLYHIPNENKSGSLSIGKELKRQGVRPGVPDNCLPLPKGGWAGFYLELKRNIGDGPTDEQWEYLRWLRAHGHYANWARGNQEAFDLLMHYIKLPFPKGVRPSQPALRDLYLQAGVKWY